MCYGHLSNNHRLYINCLLPCAMAIWATTTDCNINCLLPCAMAIWATTTDWLLFVEWHHQFYVALQRHNTYLILNSLCECLHLLRADTKECHSCLLCPWLNPIAFISSSTDLFHVSFELTLPFPSGIQYITWPLLGWTSVVFCWHNRATSIFLISEFDIPARASRDLQPLATVAATKQVIENGGTHYRS